MPFSLLHTTAPQACSFLSNDTTFNEAYVVIHQPRIASCPAFQHTLAPDASRYVHLHVRCPFVFLQRILGPLGRSYHERDLRSLSASKGLVRGLCTRNVCVPTPLPPSLAGGRGHVSLWCGHVMRLQSRHAVSWSICGGPRAT